MNARELTLNIAVNLGRLSRWAMEGKSARLDQFLKETEDYVDKLDNTPKSKQFQPTFDLFQKSFIKIKSRVSMDKEWAEDTLTWANILTHRAKLA